MIYLLLLYVGKPRIKSRKRQLEYHSAMARKRYFPPWLIILQVTLLSVIGPLSTDMYLPGLPEIVQYFGTNEAILNITLYGFLLAQAVAIAFMGPLSDKIGRKPILIGSLIVYTISSILCWIVPNVETFIVLRLFQGIGVGGFIVISTALIKDCFAEKIRDRVLTLTAAFTVLGPLIAPILGAFLIKAVNWQSTLVFPGLVTIIALIIAVFMNESLPANEKLNESIPKVVSHLFSVLKDRKFTLFLISMGIWFFPFMSFLAISSYIFEGDFGLIEIQYSLFLVANSISGTLGMIIIQKLSGKIRKTIVATAIIALGTASGLLLMGIGNLNPLVCLLCFIPTSIAAIGSRPFSLGILMKQRDGDTGSISSVFNFALTFLGCLGMFAATLPWPSHIFGLGTCVLIAAVVSITAWITLHKGGINLKGMN